MDRKIGIAGEYTASALQDSVTSNPDETPRSKFNNILLARPEGMDYNEYRLIRKYQQQVIKQYLKLKTG